MLAVLAVILACLAPSAIAHHQDPNIDSDGDGISNFNDACPYDPTPSYYGALPAPAGTCAGLEDKDGDLFNAAQDPCDNDPNNSQCDQDGDGVPDQYDLCPTEASGHMLGAETPLPNQESECSGPTDSILPYWESLGEELPLASSLEIQNIRLLSKNATQAAKQGLRVRLNCSSACTVQAGVTFPRGIAAQGIFSLEGRSTIVLPFERSARRQLSHKAHSKAVLALSAVATPGTDVSPLVTGSLSLNRRNAHLTQVQAGDPGAKQASSNLLAGNSASISTSVVQTVQRRLYTRLGAEQLAVSVKGLTKSMAAQVGCATQQLLSLWPTNERGYTPSSFDIIQFINRYTGSFVTNWCSLLNEYAKFNRALYTASQDRSKPYVLVSLVIWKDTRAWYQRAVCQTWFGVNGIVSGQPVPATTWVAHTQNNPAAGHDCV
jgi:hypothetical protein